MLLCCYPVTLNYNRQHSSARRRQKRRLQDWGYDVYARAHTHTHTHAHTHTHTHTHSHKHTHTLTQTHTNIPAPKRLDSVCVGGWVCDGWEVGEWVCTRRACARNFRESDLYTEYPDFLICTHTRARSHTHTRTHSHTRTHTHTHLCRL